MKKFKRIYIEITNMCNLNCSFCSNDNLEKREMTLEEFESILKSIDIYTDYVYLHVKGEPLLHSQFKSILELCHKYNKLVNITTNGTLLKDRLTDIKSVRQINISLQSLVNDKYLYDIFDSVKEIIATTDIVVVFRFWALKNNNFTQFQEDIINKMIDYFHLDNILLDDSKNIKLLDTLYLNKDIEFTWPNLNNKYISEIGTCRALRDHIAILVDGTVIPCCLDSKGVMILGNIYNESLESILNKKKTVNMLTNFQNNKLCEELCTKCDYRKRF